MLEGTVATSAQNYIDQHQTRITSSSSHLALGIGLVAIAFALPYIAASSHLTAAGLACCETGIALGLIEVAIHMCITYKKACEETRPQALFEAYNEAIRLDDKEALKRLERLTGPKEIKELARIIEFERALGPDRSRGPEYHAYETSHPIIDALGKERFAKDLALMPEVHTIQEIFEAQKNYALAGKKCALAFGAVALAILGINCFHLSLPNHILTISLLAEGLLLTSFWYKGQVSRLSNLATKKEYTYAAYLGPKAEAEEVEVVS